MERSLPIEIPLNPPPVIPATSATGQGRTAPRTAGTPLGGRFSSRFFRPFHSGSRSTLWSRTPSWKALETLVLYQCYLIGSIPPELGELKNLEILDLSENRLEAGSVICWFTENGLVYRMIRPFPVRKLLQHAFTYGELPSSALTEYL